MIKLRHAQPTVWEGLFAEEVAELWEPWMGVVDELLEEEELLDAVYEAQGQRHEQSRVRGRQQTPAEVALRMLILRHVRVKCLKSVFQRSAFATASDPSPPTQTGSSSKMGCGRRWLLFAGE